MFGTKGVAKRDFPWDPDIWKVQYNTAKRLHPTQKPVNLMLIPIHNSSKEGEIVLDPFMGSGTTAIACLMSNRKYIGFEKESKYVEVAERRIREFHESPKQTMLNI